MGFYPDLYELVTEETLCDVAKMNDLDGFEEVKKSKSADGDECRTAQSEVTMEGATTIASEVLAAILKQVTTENAFDVVRRCGKDGLKAYRKLRARVEPQLFGQLANAVVRLGKLTIDGTNDPVEQLGAFSDLQSSIQRYGGEHLDARTIEVIVLSNAVAAMPQCYSTVVTDIGREKKPTLESLLQQSEYFYINILRKKGENSLHDHAAPASDTAAAAQSLLNDRRRQAAEKKANDEKRQVCAVCSGKHSSENCWLVNPSDMEAYIKKYPANGAAIRERVVQRKARLESKKTDVVAAAVMTDDEIWKLADLEEVPIACSAVARVGDQLTRYDGDLLKGSWVNGVSHRDEQDLADLQGEFGGVNVAASVVDSTSEHRVLNFDSMATKSVLNRLSYFENSAVNASEAVSFKVMGKNVTQSRGAGVACIRVWNKVTEQQSILRIQAQYVPESPFNLISAVALEDAYDLYAQLRDRELSARDGSARYELVREGKVFILPECEVQEAACLASEEVVRDTVDWKFTEFARWDKEKGPFQVDMCADEHNWQLETYYSKENSVFDHVLAGKVFYGNVPYTDEFIGKFLVKVLTDFKKAPSSTKFLLVFPHKPQAEWWTLTSKLELLETYSKGSVIFSARRDQCYRVEELTEAEPGRVYIRGTPWPVSIFYLDQFTVGRVDAKILAHVRLGHVCDKYVAVMDMQGMDLGVNSEELQLSTVQRCSEQCLSCQVAKTVRPSQAMDKGRVKKVHRKEVKKRERSTRLGQLTYTDHGGPFVTSVNGYRGYTIHLDDFADFGHIYIWSRKLEYIDALQDYRTVVRTMGRAVLNEELDVREVVYDVDVLVLHSDNDTTMVAGQTKKYCEEHGILQRTSAPYLHENNARAERYNKKLQTMARAMMMTAGMPATMWPLAFRHAVYLLNRIVKADLGMLTTMTMLGQRKQADLSQLRVFGCRAYAFLDVSLRTKLDDRAIPLVYVGHDNTAGSAYLLWSWERKTVVRSGMVRFDERVNDVGGVVLSWDPAKLLPLRSIFDFRLDARYSETFVGTASRILDISVHCAKGEDEYTGVVKLPCLLSVSSASVGDISSAASSSVGDISSAESSFWTPVSVYLAQSESHLPLLLEVLNERTVNAYYPVFAQVDVQLVTGTSWEPAVVCSTALKAHDYPYQVLLLRDVGRGPRSAVDVPEVSVRFSEQHVAAAAQSEKEQWLPIGVTAPRNWAELLAAPDVKEWLESDNNEECALIDVKRAIRPVSALPAGVKALPMKAVYKPKLDTANLLDKRKSRWVVLGNKQEHGVNYEDVYAPCTQLSTLRILLQLCLVLGLLAFVLDVITCFLNSSLDVGTAIYVRWPAGREVRGTHYGLLLKSVYGLKQAPRVWYQTSKAWLLQYDARLTVSNIDPCLFFIVIPDVLVVLLYIHVDDYLCMTSSTEWKCAFFAAFHAQWPCIDRGALTEILGMKIIFTDTAHIVPGKDSCGSHQGDRWLVVPKEGSAELL
ncbi:hypothetical protein CYMTET_23899 [Cymbomonas tetramitiformis]|uniref:Integrase catalytic domain-containing protein n=1 Tax=Cymbomonas tetramitiformis TaxID=36881 RepID=A0AAE0FXF8_9CHLO|nr:hypothetical protein CYMTET_23899 [Cymbomonas tetramitiformis]